jgi:hypothetical protein
VASFFLSKALLCPFIELGIVILQQILDWPETNTLAYLVTEREKKFNDIVARMGTKTPTPPPRLQRLH